MAECTDAERAMLDALRRGGPDAGKKAWTTFWVASVAPSMLERLVAAEAARHAAWTAKARERAGTEETEES